MRAHRWWAAVLVAGCSDRPVLDTEAMNSTGTTGGSTAEPNVPTTSEAASSSGTGEVVATTGPGTSGSSSEGSSSADSGSSTTGVEVCGPPCDDPWVMQGDLTISSGASTEQYACLTRVVGTLAISGDADATALAGLRNLQEVERLRLEFNSVLTDLSPFACLEHAHEQLSIYQAPALMDASALAGLRSAAYVSFEQTGLAALPGFSPEFAGLSNLYVRGNPALVDLDVVADWGFVGGFDLAIQLDDNPALASVAGLAGLIEEVGDAGAAVQITKAPALGSLAGLEPLVRGSLWLEGLTALTDLAPLANLVDGYNVTLVGLPKIESLHGLHNMATVSTLIVGNCIDDEMAGMDGLVDLAGLDALTTAYTLAIANNANMSALTGAPLLTTVTTLNVVDNPGLAQADVDALIGQLGATPDQQCFGGWNQCQCYQLMPW